MRKFNRFRLILSGVVVAGLCSICSCTKTIYVPSESQTIHRDTLRVYRERIDSTAMRDSVIIIERGDTIREYRVRERHHYLQRTDTLYLTRHDTITESRTKIIDEQKPTGIIRDTISGIKRIIAISVLALVIAAGVYLYRRAGRG